MGALRRVETPLGRHLTDRPIVKRAAAGTAFAARGLPTMAQRAYRRADKVAIVAAVRSGLIGADSASATYALPPGRLAHWMAKL